jgi:hypothetical protein
LPTASYDSYLRSFADRVREFGHPVIIGFGLPPSGPVARWWPGPAYVTWMGIDGYF